MTLQPNCIPLYDPALFTSACNCGYFVLTPVASHLIWLRSEKSAITSETFSFSIFHIRCDICHK
jgi:hypothetical protein